MFAIKKWITLIELVIAMSILGIGLVAIMKMLNTGITYVDRTRQEVIAINLAREGIEGVYQIRNTNRMRRWGKKDECRLRTDPFSWSALPCEQGTRMQSGNYLLQTKETSEGQKYYTLTGVDAADLDLSYYTPDDANYAMCYSVGSRYPCPGDENNATREGRFFRQIDGLGLYRKDTNQTGGVYIDCQNGEDVYENGSEIICGNSVAKEYRFCSVVQYVKQLQWEVKLCGVITNFIE